MLYYIVMNLVYMKHAIEEAKKSGIDMPIAAVIVKNGEIIASCHNQKELNNDVTAHAEILAIKKAENILKNWRLKDCDMYVTLEPCPMCASAILQSRLSNLYFGAYDNIYGGFSVFPELKSKLNPNINIKGGILETECKELLDDYFDKLRKNK